MEATRGADVIRLYVQRGVGVGIVSEMAVDKHAATDGLKVLQGSKQLFEASVTKVAFQRGALLHAFAYRFVEIFAPHLAALELREAALSRLSLRAPHKKQTAETLRIPAYGDPLPALVSA